MSQVNEEFNLVVNEFLKVTKRILQNRPLTTNAKKIDEYIEQLCITYNDTILFVVSHRNILENEKVNFDRQISNCRVKLSSCFLKLNCNIEIPDTLSIIKYVKQFSEKDLFSGGNSSFELKTRCDSLSNVSRLLVDNKDLVIRTSSSPEISLSNHKVPESVIFDTTIMATLAQKKEFVNMCANIIRHNYDGNPLGLESFIDKINLIEGLTEDSLQSTFVSFIRAKLEGKARECVPTDVSSISQIKTSLRQKIKPDNSKVVAGKFASCKVRNGNFSDFSKQLEELADALERSLIVEGMTQTKAHELAIEQTVNTCRTNARSDLVKSVLASTTFSDPKDVVAKLIVEENNCSHEKQVLRLSTNHGRNTRFSNNTNRHPNNNTSNNYGRNRNRFQNNRHNNNYNNNNNSNSSNYNNRGNRDFSNNNQRRYSNTNRNNYNNTANVRTLNADSHQRSLEEE